MEWVIGLACLIVGLILGSYIQKKMLLSKLEVEFKNLENVVVADVNAVKGWWTNLKSKL